MSVLDQLTENAKKEELTQELTVERLSELCQQAMEASRAKYDGNSQFYAACHELGVEYPV